jgi:hypothetical protein
MARFLTVFVDAGGMEEFEKRLAAFDTAVAAFGATMCAKAKENAEAAKGKRT